MTYKSLVAVCVSQYNPLKKKNNTTHILTEKQDGWKDLVLLSFSR